MKVIALLPFKNEEQMLPSFLSNIAPAVDEIVAIDDGSTDRSVEILKEAGAHVYSNDLEVKSGWAELGIREKLLQLGREHGGTHFAVMDADETFTGQFPAVCRKICERLEPGQKIRMQWLAMWKSVDHYREDNSVWSNNYKDFIFADDGKMEYPKVWMHTPRTPGENTDDNSMILNPKYGAVIHFQFSDWSAFQIKQAWYRCSEWIRDQGNAGAVNQKYRITMDDPNAVVVALPEAWQQGVVFPKVSYEPDTENWRLKQMLNWMEEYGVDFFKPLEIWHIPELDALRK